MNTDDIRIHHALALTEGTAYPAAFSGIEVLRYEGNGLTIGRRGRTLVAVIDGMAVNLEG